MSNGINKGIPAIQLYRGEGYTIYLYWANGYLGWFKKTFLKMAIPEYWVIFFIRKVFLDFTSGPNFYIYTTEL